MSSSSIPRTGGHGGVAWRAAAPLCALALGVSAWAQAQTAGTAAAGRLELKTSDKDLAAAFEWARRQALAYAFTSDPVGDWYEAALPGREAFCMRDVSHQAMGAHALGLDGYTRNMLHHFAAAVSDSKDWCSYWEINRYGLPAPVDYHNDAEFWYNLPANFDVLDCCYRMYLWSGDRTYLTDPAFLNFYRRTVHDYVQRWDLGVDRIMSRRRILNVRGRLDPQNRFQTNRGIPSYDEGPHNFVVGVDQLAAEYAGFRAYARLQQLAGHGEEAREFLKRAREVRDLLDNNWWDKETRTYYSYVNLQHELIEPGYNASLLYYDAIADGGRKRGLVDGILRGIGKKPMGVEGQSHLPEILYRWGKADAAYRQILDLTSPETPRREYPEVSYSVIGAIVTGLMGINLEPAAPDDALTESMYVDRTLTTLPRLTSQTAWAELLHLPVRANEISVRHDGLRKTTLVNLAGPSLMWKACFPGSSARLLVGGKMVPANRVSPGSGLPETTCAPVTVGAGESKTVQVPE